MQTTIQKLGLALDETSKYNKPDKKNGRATFKQRLASLRDKRMVFIFDECHRSQFGENHRAIKEFFPNSQLFGFTGTPIFEDNATVKQIEGNHYIDVDVLEQIRGKPVPAGTILFAKIVEAIRSDRRVVTTRPAVIDNNTAGVKAIEEKCSDDFLFYLWSNVSLIDHAGGVVPAVSKSALENIPLCYPSDPVEQQKIADYGAYLGYVHHYTGKFNAYQRRISRSTFPPTAAEQHRIADCLSSLDALLAAQARKIDAIKQHKQGLLQQLFPALEDSGR